MIEKFCQCPALDEKITAILGDYADPQRVLELMEKQIYIEHFLK